MMQSIKEVVRPWLVNADAVNQHWPLEFDEAGNLISLADKHNLRQCTTCDDKGFVRKHVPENHPDYGKAFPCPNSKCPTSRDLRMSKMERLMRNSGIPEGYKKFSFETWDMQPLNLRQGKFTARLALEMYVRRQGEPFALAELPELMPDRAGREAAWKRLKHATAKKSGIILTGANGVGKTGLLMSAAMALLNAEIPVLVTNALSMLTDMFESYGKEDAAARLRQSIQQIDHWFMDELTFETRDSHRRHLQEFTRYRHDHDLPMCFTTNLPMSGLEQFFGVQTATGIFGKCHWIEMGGAVIRHEVDNITGEDGTPF